MRKPILYSLIFLIGVFMLTSSSFKKKNSRYFSCHARFVHSSLRLFDNGKFEQYKRSCTYVFRSKGTWKAVGDTFYLEPEKVKWNKNNWRKNVSHASVERANKLIAISPDSLQYAFDKEFGSNLWMVLTEE